MITIRIDIEVDKRVVRRFVRSYRVKNDTAHTHAQKWGRSRAEEQGLGEYIIHTKTMK